MASSSSRDPSNSVLRKLQKFKQSADSGDARGRRPQSRRASITTARPLPPPKDELLIESSQHSRGQHTQLPKHAAPQNRRLVPNTYHRPEGMRKEDWILICTDKLRSKDQTIDDLEAKVLELDHVRQRLEEDLHGREDEINKMQESVFQNISETRWQPLDDAAISNDLMLLQSSIARFAKSYAIEGSKVWPSERLVQLKEALRSRNVATFSSTQELLQLIELRYGPRLCLSGLLSAAVHATVFANPFFFLADHPQDVTPAYIFEDLCKRVSTNYEKEANIWRSDTLRLFALLRNEEVEGDHENADQSIKEGITNACGQAISDLEMGPIKFLLPQMESSTREAYTRAIRAIFEQAAQSAMRLWIQRPDIKYLGFEDLKGTPFSSDSMLLEAHNVHQLCDSDDHRLDGKAIKMVLQPAIIGMGSHEGENYDQTRVWAKAFVLVDEGDPGSSE